MDESMKNNRVRIILFAIILTFAFGLSLHAQIPTDTRKDALVASGIDGTCRMDSIVLKRYNIFPGWAECGDLLDSAKHYNPNSIVLLYNSGTDNYTTPGVTFGNYYGGVEHNWLRNRCIELGYSPEILYLHFYEDTELSGWSIPGTYSTNFVLADSVSRAPDYLPYYEGNGIGRIIVNYANPITRQLEIEYACMVFDSLSSSMWNDLSDRNSHFDGIYLDNWMHNWGRRQYGSMGRVDSGGRIAETPGSNLVYGTEEFAAWYWEQMKQFSAALRDTLMQGANWTPDGKRKYLAINVGQSWNSDYTNPNLSGGDFVVMEYLYSPIRNPNTSIYGLPGMTTKDSLCALNGASLVYCSRQEIGDDGEYSWGDAVYNNMVSFYALTSGDSYLFQRGGLGAPYTAQYNPNFDSLAWRGCMDYDLGNALGHYTIKQTGTDPTGQSYTVFERDYQKGKVLMRPLDDWGQTFASNTKISVPLTEGYRKLNIDGSLGPVIMNVELQNGAGAVLIPADVGDCTSPPTIPTFYSPSNGQDAGVRPTLCVNNSYPGVCLVGLTYGFQISTTQDMSIMVAEREGVPEGSSITCYTTSIELAPGTYYWRTRAYNGTVYSGWSAVRSFTVAGTADNPPSVPALSSPGGGAEVNTLTPTLTVYNSYDADGDLLTYQFQVSENIGFTSIVAQSSDIAQGTGSSTSWTVPSGLFNSMTYYWRARAYDGSQYSGWSGVRSFFVQVGQDQPPSIPEIYSPENGVNVSNLWPTLVIHNSIDPDGDFVYYQFQVSESSTFTIITAEISNYSQSSSSTTSWTVPVQLHDQTTYWWRVRAFDGVTHSEYCQPSSFFVNTSSPNHPPTAPSANSPGDGDVVYAVSPVIAVNNSYDEDWDHLTYYFEVWDNLRQIMITASPAVAQNSRGTTQWQIDKVLQGAHRYYWRCRASDGNDYSVWMDWIDFIVSSDADDNNPPDPPHAYLPRAGDSVIGVSHELVVFNADDPDGDPLTYEFNICSDSTMSQVVDHADGIAEGAYLMTSYMTQADFDEGGIYYWQARVYDGQDYSSWTEKRDFIHFDIASSAEDIPTPLSPLEGDRLGDIRPQFKISTDESDVGVNFYYEAADNKKFNMPIVSGPIKGESPVTIWIPDIDLKPTAAYYWRVRAEKSGWSEPISFHIDAAIHISPNPYKPFENGDGVIFKNIPEGSDIKILTLNGDIIKEFTDTRESEIQWDVTNDQGRKLASGVYLYYVYSNGAVFSGKLAVIR